MSAWYLIISCGELTTGRTGANEAWLVKKRWTRSLSAALTERGKRMTNFKIYPDTFRL